MAVYALTHKHAGLANTIVTPVELKDPFSNSNITTNGIWDTGATDSVITKSAAALLGLKPIQKAVVNGVHGPREVNVYYINITLNNKSITLNAKVTECEELSMDHGSGMLIGMNIISMGDFSITNFGGNTVMSFRVPSLQVIDYVQGIKTSTPLVKDKIPGRNDPCFCGSGKKYKNCHGKDK